MSVISAAMLVAACGGGGVASSGSAAPPVATTPVPTPTPAPTPTPSPTPTPTSSADTAEYKASGAVVLAKAAYAYDRGITGKGVTIAVIDTGINRTTPEFSGRISSYSTGFEQKIARCGTCAPETVPPYPIDDKVGHGTEVASIAAAARNGSGPQGLAPDATILALKIVAPNLDGVTAGSTTPIPEGEGSNPQLTATAIRYAVDKGAFVSVLALNGVATGQIATDQRAAMDAVRAADRLVVESISNFTDEDSFTGKIAQNLVGTDLANKDWFLFAIGVDQNGNPRSANGNAGPLADRMIAAAGNGVQVVDKDGNYATVIGNSFAAPAVAGAAALLKQYWPQLGGRAISRILLDTATDAGAPGVDQVYGVGILNVEKAMQAQAPASSFAVADAVLARFSSLSVSAPFGGSAGATAIADRTGGMTVFDRYGRDYRMEGTTGVRAAGSGLLSGASTMPVDAAFFGMRSDTRLGFAPVVPQAWQGGAIRTPAIASFSPAAGHVVTFGANVGVAPGADPSTSPLRAIVTTPIGTTMGWAGRGWSAGFSSGSSRDGRASLRTMRFATPVGLGFEVTGIDERGQALGLRGDASLGIRGARTTMATLSAIRGMAGVIISARASVSSTMVDATRGLLRFDGALVGTAFGMDASHRLLGGAATMGLSSPLKLERARGSKLMPISYDLISGALVTEWQQMDLAPAARELDLSLGWSKPLSGTSSIRFGVARAFAAGNVAGATDVAGFATLVIN